jgi:hypothetical protein
MIHSYFFDGGSPVDVSPFDPTLGTLDSVSVSLMGRMTVTGNTLPLFSPYGPIPTTYFLTVEQNFLGLGSNLFDFGSPAQYFLTGVASGGAEPVFLFRDLTPVITRPMRSI